MCILIVSGFTNCGDAVAGLAGGIRMTAYDAFKIGSGNTDPVPDEGSNIIGDEQYLDPYYTTYYGSATHMYVITGDDGSGWAQNAVWPAIWNIDWIFNHCQAEQFTTDDIQTNQDANICPFPAASAAPADTQFALATAQPSTLTISLPGFSTTYGPPTMRFYNGKAKLIKDVQATSVASDGSSATFPVPPNSTGGALASDLYFYSVDNPTSVGSQPHGLGLGYLSLGSSTTLATPFGIEAVDRRVLIQNRNPGGGTSSTITPYPIITLYNNSQVTYKGRTIAVGTQPIAVKAWGTKTTTSTSNNVTTTTFDPQNAIVVNMGSNSVTFVDLISSTAVANTAVGSQPVALAIRAGKAYVANYGSGTISEVDLTSHAVTHTIAVGNNPSSVASDPTNNAVWVGGFGYIAKVDLTSYSVTQTVAQNGLVNSIAASNAQNELVYTLVSSSSGSSAAGTSGQTVQFASSDQTVNELALSNMTNSGSYGRTSAAAYSNYTLNNTLVNPGLQPGGTQISGLWGNGMAGSATPTGFVIYDIVNHVELMRGNTATPVRGIASDPSNLVAYVTTPDSNSYITIPLPHH